MVCNRDDGELKQLEQLQVFNNTLTFRTAINVVLLLIKVHLLWRNCFNLKLLVHPTPVFYHRPTSAARD